MKLNASAFTAALVRSLEAATDSTDISKTLAVEKITHRLCGETKTFQNLVDSITWRPIDWITVHAPVVDKELKIATGKDRDEWCELLT